ncbi:hypothetical protein PHYBLDRAFT_76923 [Phycomyces blakesleeanus NRRL 1555(-)]|uniref:Peptidase M12B propeptide domain-containing protein n=1 Tax=Phycomyces blakesleeanus (strain ATCC 8743b / DSM 1359 / FGSC 10004 / NBRC 33097 / NRRL 1555) TaxID=763407 RepID=A0A162V996_PHYB8|nr:hypothetical protein PHYBLDRAFT_76923 [Phycomyces blakesleeanus NRRL 1555(-)]OAD81013.1 hypothetical protein PHYBLDRAFT_76923 [Phycomyces blakesleeanus NRRL 1555(-)]|eukprot:XP_018299053.1 hypothetical protein PHYBLDRAFT_76923 [Phycomyces blakesleeanus NRRL 1555(-)]
MDNKGSWYFSSSLYFHQHLYPYSSLYFQLTTIDKKPRFSVSNSVDATPHTILVALIVLCSRSTINFSIDNKRLTRVEPLQNIKLDIAPRLDHFYQKRQLTRNQAHEPTARSVEHDDTLRLTIEAYNQTFHLHLEPNTDLFHPNAVTVNEHGVTEPLIPESFRVYRGYAIETYYSDNRWKADQAGIKRDDFTAQYDVGVLGWARVIVRHDIKHSLDYPIVEGSFRAYGDLYHIKATSNYKLAKRLDDAELSTAFTCQVFLRI